MIAAIKACADYCDIDRTRDQLLVALGKVRPDGVVRLDQDELESALWSTCVAVEDGLLSLELNPWIHQVLPDGFTVDPYFCFIRERGKYV